jgi:hypothetical protein
MIVIKDLKSIWIVHGESRMSEQSKAAPAGAPVTVCSTRKTGRAVQAAQCMRLVRSGSETIPRNLNGSLSPAVAIACQIPAKDFAWRDHGKPTEVRGLFSKREIRTLWPEVD